MSEKEFSLEQSEELIAHLKSGAPSEFEQLRSALNLLAHVPEISPVATPPVLPSSISQPVPVVPIKSSKPRRTIVTSIVIMGLFASGSLAAAAVTGIGPSIFVNAGHSAAKFVKNVVGGVSHVVTGSNSDSNQNQASGSEIPGVTTTILPTPNSNSNDGNNQSNNEENNQNNSDETSLVLPLISNLIPPLSTSILTNSSSHENESQTPNSSHETQGPSSEDSNQKAPKAEKSQPPSEDQNQSESHPIVRPTPEAPTIPSAEPTSEPSILPTIEPSSQPTTEPSIMPSVNPSILPTESTDQNNSEN